MDLQWYLQTFACHTSIVYLKKIEFVLSDPICYLFSTF